MIASCFKALQLDPYSHLSATAQCYSAQQQVPSPGPSTKKSPPAPPSKETLYIRIQVPRMPEPPPGDTFMSELHEVPPFPYNGPRPLGFQAVNVP